MPNLGILSVIYYNGDSSNSMKKIIVVMALVMIALLIISSVGGCSVCSNPTHVKWFGEDGRLIEDTSLTNKDSFLIRMPSKVHFYMEASGSMNGFLRGGVPTDFKKDVWQVINYYSNHIPYISVLSSDNGGTKAVKFSVSQFQNPFNSGGFVCGQSTHLHNMIKDIMSDFDSDNDEVAVFVSDMEYDPVGAVAPQVLASVFATDIATTFAHFRKSASLVAAISNSVDKQGNIQTTQRPYYYLIMGKAECVASVRNCISSMLDTNNHFIDNIETGFDYGNVPYSISSFSGCVQVGKDPSFHSITSAGCKIVLGLKLENYRWLLSTDKDVMQRSFKISSLNGTKVTVDSISYDIKNVVDNQLKRDATALVHISVHQMPYDCDILKWYLDIPVTDNSRFAHLFTDTPNSLEQTFSLKEFIIGMFRASLVCTYGKENYIHISKQ